MKSVKQHHIVNVRVVENRLSHLIIGLLTLGTMTRPLLVVLGTMPRAVFAGIFILVGWASIERNNITMRTLAIFRDRRLSPPDEPLNTVRRSKIALFVGIQWLFAAMTIGISATIAGIGFPVIITLLIPLRYWIVPRWFSPLELKILDAPTADADGVLASLGHEPERVTGRGVEVAVDTGIAGELYFKKSLDSDEDEDEREGGMGGEKTASRFRNDYARHSRTTDDQEARAGENDELQGAVRTVAGLGGHESADPARHAAAASGAGIIASGLGSGAAAAVEDERKQEAEQLAEQHDSEAKEPATPTRAATTVATTATTSEQPSTSRFVEQISQTSPMAQLHGSPKSPRKPRYVSVENPSRGAGSPPAPIQWRGVGDSEA